MNKLLLLLALIVPTLLLSACTTGSGDDDDASGDDDDSTPYEQPGPYADMDFDQRVEYMEEVVLPEMAQAFWDYDPVEYEDFSCESCHGENAEADEYEMPSGIAPLRFPTPADATEWERDTREWMDDFVKPRMAELTDQEEWAQNNPDGMRCTSCHDQK